MEDSVSGLGDFVDEYFVAILNVAGPRASGEAKVDEYVTDVPSAAFGDQIS